MPIQETNTLEQLKHNLFVVELSDSLIQTARQFNDSVVLNFDEKTNKFVLSEYIQSSSSSDAEPELTPDPPKINLDLSRRLLLENEVPPATNQRELIAASIMRAPASGSSHESILREYRRGQTSFENTSIINRDSRTGDKSVTYYKNLYNERNLSGRSEHTLVREDFDGSFDEFVSRVIHIAAKIENLEQRMSGKIRANPWVGGNQYKTSSYSLNWWRTANWEQKLFLFSLPKRSNLVESLSSQRWQIKESVDTETKTRIRQYVEDLPFISKSFLSC